MRPDGADANINYCGTTQKQQCYRWKYSHFKFLKCLIHSWPEYGQTVKHATRPHKKLAWKVNHASNIQNAITSMQIDGIIETRHIDQLHEGYEGRTWRISGTLEKKSLGEICYLPWVECEYNMWRWCDYKHVMLEPGAVVHVKSRRKDKKVQCSTTNTKQDITVK